MNFLSEVCFLCLNKYKILNSVSQPDNDGIVVEEKIKCCLSELTNFKPEIPKNICNTCLQNLNSFYIFKLACLRNNATLNVYLQHITAASAALKQLSETATTAEEPNNSEEEQPQKENIVVKAEPEETTSETPDTQFNFEFVSMCEPVLNEPEDPSSSQENAKKTKKISENTSAVQRKFTCPICEESFYDKDILVYHLQSHAEIRNFKCLYCSKTFLQKSHLIQHTETHTGIKDFECARCGKKFGRKSSLIEHEKIHTGVKDYECTLCNKQFLLKKNLVRHMKNTHPEIKDFTV